MLLASQLLLQSQNFFNFLSKKTAVWIFRHLKKAMRGKKLGKRRELFILHSHPPFSQGKERRKGFVSHCTKGSRFADEMTLWPLEPLKGSQWHKPHIINHILGLWSAPGRTGSPLSRTVNRHPILQGDGGMKHPNSIPLFSSLCVCVCV